MIPITFFRSSSYNRWDFCPLLFLGEYCLGLTSPSGLAAAKGTCVHKVLEVMALCKKEQQENEKVKNGHTGEKVNRVSVVSHIDDEIVGKVSVDNYDVEDLINKSYKRYSENLTHLKWAPKDYKEVAKWTWMALEHDGGALDPRNLDVIDAEPYFDFPIEEPWAAYSYKVGGKKIEGVLRMKGTIDLIHRIDGDIIEINDWKTGGSTKNWATGKLRDQKYFQEEDFQLRLYHLAATHLYPWASQIFVNIFFIRGGGCFSVCFDDKDTQKTYDMIRARFKEIKECDNPRPRRGWHCNLCHMKKQSFNEYGCHQEKTMVEFRHRKFAKKGEEMKMCDQLNMDFDRIGCANTIKKYTKSGFSLGTYEEPGGLK